MDLTDHMSPDQQTLTMGNVVLSGPQVAHDQALPDRVAGMRPAFGAPYGADQKTALDHQEGGSHYKDKGIQPVEYIHANKLGFCEGNVVKYVTRWKDKDGLKDLKKARHYIDLLIELEQKQQA